MGNENGMINYYKVSEENKKEILKSFKKLTKRVQEAEKDFEKSNLWMQDDLDNFFMEMNSISSHAYDLKQDVNDAKELHYSEPDED